MTSAQAIHGTLIPIGGNEDKNLGNTEDYTLDFIEEGILSHVVRESGGRTAKVAVITTASEIPVEVGKNYMHAFGSLGVADVRVLDIRSREQTDRPEFLSFIEQCDCVMFSGGDQSKIVTKIGGTRMHQVMWERYVNERFVIAGTSAGAMCMSQEMIAESWWMGTKRAPRSFLRKTRSPAERVPSGASAGSPASSVAGADAGGAAARRAKVRASRSADTGFRR